MKFDTPAGPNPIDALRVVGRPTDRIDGRLKTTGTAPYAYERHDVAPNQAYGFVVGAAIPKGRIVSMNTDAAKSAAGVLAVVTALDMPSLGKGALNVARLFGGAEVEHYHQAVAVVVAESFEQARAAAGLIHAEYETSPGRFVLVRYAGDAKPVPPEKGKPPEARLGDFEGAFAAAPVKVDAHYVVPDESHMMMEPFASIAAWDGDAVTVWTSNQMIHSSKMDLAATLRVPPEKVRLDSPFIGGGFGGKLWLRADAVLAAIGARAAGRPVKVALTRPLIPNNSTHRPATVQHVRLGAAPDGTLLAIGHESLSGNLPGGKPETATAQTQLLYAGANRLEVLRLTELDLPEGNSMRAPGEAPGLMALEVAMDELADKLGIDPIALRIKNDTAVDPEKPTRAFSQRLLVPCLQQGAARFGWSARQAPGKRMEGRWLVGMGVAAGFRNNVAKDSGARVRLDSSGTVTVETDMTDIGTGTYTIIAQTVAEMMGVPLHRVVVKLGDSDYPVSCGSGGQFGAANSTSGVFAACTKLRDALAQRAGFHGEVRFADGHIHSSGRSVPLASLAAGGDLVAEDKIEYGNLSKRFQESTFAAHFVEVGVDRFTGETRVRRMLAVCAAGRILNPKSARSQVIGGMTMGVGAALTEELQVDPNRGYFVNHDLAQYEVPVHADIPHQEVVFLDDPDPIASPMKAKGIGELGLCGVGAAVSNAIYNATGVRVREYPITVDKLIEHLPAVA